MNVEIAAFRFIADQSDTSETSTPPNDLNTSLKQSDIPFRVEELKLTAEQAKNHPDAHDLFEKATSHKLKTVFIYKFFTSPEYNERAKDVLNKLMQKYEDEEKAHQMK